MAIKDILVKLWNDSFDVYIETKVQIMILIDIVNNTLFPYHKIASIEETIERIVTTHCSVSRFGDGELNLILCRDIGFQEKSEDLGARLEEVLSSDSHNHIVCLPGILVTTKPYDDFTKKVWQRYLISTRKTWKKYTHSDKLYYDAFLSRCYIGMKDKKHCKHYFDLLKKIWSGRDIIIVEGEKSRLGIGNDLFSTAKSIKRILCPAKNAFDFYSEIKKSCLQWYNDELFLIALGPTATVLAYDLAQDGVQAIDIGHVDIEYEWYLMGATKKEIVKNKYVNEVVLGGRDVDECQDVEYPKQIIAKVGI